jgi:enoyl-CoA hydratase
VPAWNTLKLVDDGPHVATLVLDRPERRNAISREMAAELAACAAHLHARADLRVLVVTGATGAFCAGADLKERAGSEPGPIRRQREDLLRCIELLEALPAPVIAMIDGPAFAGGFELALGCDIRIASERSSFALTEVRNAGSFPGGGGPVRLAKLVGRGRANLVVLSGRTFSAREGFELGFVEQVVPDARLHDEVRALAQRIAGSSPLGVRAAKQLIRRSLDMDVQAAMDLSRALRDPLEATHDAQEGIRAWVEKREPVFRGE